MGWVRKIRIEAEKGARNKPSETTTPEEGELIESYRLLPYVNEQI